MVRVFSVFPVVHNLLREGSFGRQLATENLRRQHVDVVGVLMVVHVAPDFGYVCDYFLA